MEQNKQKRFFFIRHGRTDANHDGRFCGRSWDIDINAVGCAEAEGACEQLKDHAASIKTVCYSPLLRAAHTKDILMKVLPDAKQIAVPDLEEWDVGAWSRQKMKDVFPGNENFLEFDPPGGETMDDFRQRVARGLALALDQKGDVLIVAHSVVGRVVQELFLGTVHEIIPNATLREFTVPANFDFSSFGEDVSEKKRAVG